MGRQHQGMDKPGVRQVPEGSGEQGKMEKTGCKIICGAPTTLAVKKLMIIMMIIVVYGFFQANIRSKQAGFVLDRGTLQTKVEVLCCQII